MKRAFLVIGNIYLLQIISICLNILWIIEGFIKEERIEEGSWRSEALGLESIKLEGSIHRHKYNLLELYLSLYYNQKSLKI